jgi:hypothetical protein
LSRHTSLNEAPSAIRSQTFSANSGVYRVSGTFDFSLFIVIASRARIARLTQISLSCDAVKPIAQIAYSALDGTRFTTA